MTTITLRNVLTGAALLVASATASAFCVDIDVKPDNDVAVTGCGVAAPGVTVCDMNGVQERWATHGVLASDQGGLTLSWTRNTPDVTEEYVCRIGATGGTGAVHIFNGMLGAPKMYMTFNCQLTQACD